MKKIGKTFDEKLKEHTASAKELETFTQDSADLKTENDKLKTENEELKAKLKTQDETIHTQDSAIKDHDLIKQKAGIKSFIEEVSVFTGDFKAKHSEMNSLNDVAVYTADELKLTVPKDFDAVTYVKGAIASMPKPKAKAARKVVNMNDGALIEE